MTVRGTEKSLPETGVMLDCSRGAVTSIPALKCFLRLCADMGYSFVGLYIEDTIAVEGEPYFGYQRGRYTKDEIREADEYAQSLGLELRPYIQTLAHLNQITDYADYVSCIDTDDILLAGDEKTYRLLDHLLHTISETFSTRKVNIGMDEAHMVGLGKYLDRHGYCDRVEILRKHLDKVLGLCRKHGLQPEMWSDMFFRLLTHGEYYLEGELPQTEKPDIPEKVTLCYWDYYSLDREHYQNMMKLHRLLTQRISFAGGAWRWIGFAPCNRYSIPATFAALEVCHENNITSIVLTMWGDDGGECSIFSLLPTLWQASVKVRELWGGSSLPVSFEEISGYSMEEFLLLDESNPPGGDPTAKNNLCKILFYNDPLLGIFDRLTDPAGMKQLAEAFSGAKKRLEKVIVQRENSREPELTGAERSVPEPGKNPDFLYLFQTQAALCNFLSVKTDFGVRLRAAYRDQDREVLSWIARKEIALLIQKLDHFYICLRRQWMKENKSFGFEVHTIRIGGMKQRLEDIRTLLQEYLDGNVPEIRELEEPLLPPGYVFEHKDPYHLVWERYEKIATTSRLTW